MEEILEMFTEIDKSIVALNKAGATMTSIERGIVGKLRNFPQSDAVIEKALFELLAAKEAKDENFRIFPRDQDPEVYNNSEECRQHWSMAHNRFDKAVSNLVSMAFMLREAKKLNGE